MDGIKVISRLFFVKGGRLHGWFLIALFLITAVITLQSRHYRTVSPRAGLVYVLLISSIYTGRWLVQRFIITSRWWLFVLFGVLAICLLSGIGIAGMYYLLGYRDGANISALVVVTPLLVIVSILIGSLISILRILVRQQLSEAQALEYQKNAEIKQLTDKLSPHFLFNILNTLYGLSINAPQQVPDLLLQLSGLLRYNVYSSNLKLVLLDEEIAYLSNYIALQRVRMMDRLKLEIEISNSGSHIRIAPLLLITFIENAFKHAKHSLSETVEITIKLWTTPENIYFTVCNSLASRLEYSADTANQSGFGLPATIQRLNLLYHKAYSLKYGERNKNFEVELILENRFE